MLTIIPIAVKKSLPLRVPSSLVCVSEITIILYGSLDNLKCEFLYYKC